jgi:hypothetical protein
MLLFASQRARSFRLPVALDTGVTVKGWDLTRTQVITPTVRAIRYRSFLGLELAHRVQVWENTYVGRRLIRFGVPGEP